MVVTCQVNQIDLKLLQTQERTVSAQKKQKFDMDNCSVCIKPD